jgi:hypothetical protein
MCYGMEWVGGLSTVVVVEIVELEQVELTELI